MAADRGQPFAQRGMLDRLEDLVFGLDDVVEGQRHAGRKLLEYLDHHRVRGGDAAVQGLAAVGGVNPSLSGNAARMRCRMPCGIERPRDRIGGAQRPGLHRAMVKRVGENEQPRHRAVGSARSLLRTRCTLSARPQIDIDHDAGEIAGGRIGNIRGRNGVDVADGSAECWPVRCSGRSDPKPAAGGVWTKAGSLGLSWILGRGDATDSKDYPTTGSPRLKRHCERGSSADRKNLAIAMGTA